MEAFHKTCFDIYTGTKTLPPILFMGAFHKHVLIFTKVQSHPPLPSSLIFAALCFIILNEKINPVSETFKETVGIILSDLPLQNHNSQFTMVPDNFFSGQ